MTLSPERLVFSRLLTGALMVVTAIGWAGCSRSSDTRSAENGTSALNVVTSVAPLTSIVSAIAGDRARVVGLIPEGTDSHTFELPPSAVERIARADVIYLNGLDLDEQIRQAGQTSDASGVEESRGDSLPKLVLLGDQALPTLDRIYDRSFPKSQGRPNPHLWTAPRYCLSYARIIAKDLSQRDPAHSGEFQANLSNFRQDIDALDQAMRQSFATIPVTQRKLLTYHDAYAYFARDYGFEVIGAIQPTSFADPSPKQVAELIDQVRQLGVPAIFGSEVFPSPVLEQIGREANVRYVDELRDDDLPGDSGDASHSLIGLLRFNYMTITDALGGDSSPLKNLSLRNGDRESFPMSEPTR